MALRSKSSLKIESGMMSEMGPNDENDDCMGIRIPEKGSDSLKGIAAVIADGVSAAEAGKQAAEICVKGFLNDYYDSPEAWTTATSGRKVFLSLNRWLYSLSQSSARDGNGYVTTLTAVVFKGQSIHVFHAGDTRVYRLRNEEWLQLTRDHSYQMRQGASGLARAVGMDSRLEVDVADFQLQKGDRFLLSSDGVHGFLEDAVLKSIVEKAEGCDLDAACREVCRTALQRGSNDNCTAVLLEVQEIGEAGQREHERTHRKLPFPPDLDSGMKIDGYGIEKEIAASSRSQIYLARDLASGREVVLKTPSVTYSDDPSYIDRFIMEGWIGKRLNNEHLLRAYNPSGEQNFLYTVLEYVEGESLENWMKRNPNPDIRQVVAIARHVLKGLRAMHRQEMIHQDLKPSNVIIHPERGAVIIDYGSTYVSGLQELDPRVGGSEHALGTLSYSAPECFLGKRTTWRSDLFSLGVIVYEMLTGKLPYGDRYERCHSGREFSVLKYVHATKHNSHVPVWIDGAIAKAVSVNPQSRYESLSEFEFDLEHPNAKFLPQNAGPFIERHPVRFWKIVSGILLVTQALTLWWILTR